VADGVTFPAPGSRGPTRRTKNLETMTDLRSQRHARSGLKVMALVLGLQALFFVLGSVVSSWAITRIAQGGRLSSWLHVIWFAKGVSYAVLEGLFVAGILRYRRGLGELIARRMLAVAAGILGALAAWWALFSVDQFVADLARRPSLVLGGLEPGSYRWLAVVESGLYLLGVVLLVVAVARASWRISRRLAWPALVLVGLALAMNIVRALGLEILRAYAASPAWQVVSALPSLFMLGGMLWLILDHRRGLSTSTGEDRQPAPAPGDLPPLSAAWERAGRGLALYRAGILLQLAGGILGAIIVRAAACGPTDLGSAAATVENVKAALVFSAVLSLALGVVPLAGLVRYARIPEESGARGAAVLGLLCVVCGLLGGLVAGGLVLQATSSSSIWALYDLQKQLPLVEGPTYLVAFVGIFALLRSYAAAARFLDLEAADRRARGAAVAVLVLGPVVVLARFLALKLPAGMLLVLALAALGGAIAFFVVYLQIIRTLLEAIRRRTLNVVGER
jgi:hypothetical protein